MSLSLSQAVVELKDQIAVSGSKGVLFQTLLIDLKISNKLGLFIGKRFLSRDGYSFQIENEKIDIHLMTEDSPQFVHVLCTAPVQNQWAAWGIQSGPEVPTPNTHVSSLLELIARSKNNGCVHTETFAELKTNKVHVHVDKVVSLGAIVKNTIYPTSKGSHRIKQRCTILHLKRFAAKYDPSLDGVQFARDDLLKEQIFSLIHDIMVDNDLHMVPARDLARYLGISKRGMQYIRNQGVAYAKKQQDCKVRFFEAMCNPSNKRGDGVSGLTLAWCVARNTPDTVQATSEQSVVPVTRPDRSLFSTSRNLALWEHISASLRTAPRGLSTNDLTHICCVSTKFAYRITSLFVHTLQYPVRKLQDGKQMRYMLFHPTSVDGAVSVAETSLGGAAAPRDRAVLESDGEDGGSAPHHAKKARHAPPLSGARNAVAAAISETGEGCDTKLVVNKRVISQTSGVALSDLQIHRAEVVMDFLSQRGGVASVLEVRQQVRAVHSAEGHDYLVDKRTVARCLERLVAEGRIRLVEAAVPDPFGDEDADGDTASAATPTVQKVAILVGFDSSTDEQLTQRLAERYVAACKERLAATESRRTVAQLGRGHSGRLHRKRGGNQVDQGFLVSDEEASVQSGSDSEKDTGNQRKTPRKKSRTDSPSLQPDSAAHKVRRLTLKNFAAFELPKLVKDLPTLVLGYVPPGFCVSCMNLHLQLAKSLLRAGDTRSNNSINLASGRVTFSPQELLLNMPVAFLFKNYSYLLQQPALDLLATSAECMGLFDANMRNESMSASEFIHAEDLLGFCVFRGFVDSLALQFGMQLVFLVSVGVLKSLDAALVASLQEGFGDWAADAMCTSTVTTNNGDTVTPIGLYAADRTQMRLFAVFLSHLISMEQDSAFDVDRFLLRLLQGLFQLNSVPVGNRRPVDDRDSLFVHWRDVVVDSVVFTEDEGQILDQDLVFASYGKRGPDEEEQAAKTSSSAGRHRVKLYSGMSNPDILWAWKVCAPLPLRYLMKSSVRYFQKPSSKVGKAKGTRSAKDAVAPQISMVESEADQAGEDDEQRDLEEAPQGAHEDEDHDLVASEDAWSREQDIQLMNNFFTRLLTKLSLAGFPVELYHFSLDQETAGSWKEGLKSTKLREIAVADSAFARSYKTHPSASCLSVDYSSLEFHHLNETTHSRISQGTSHTMSAAKKRISVLVKSVRNMRRLSAMVLCHCIDANAPTAPLASDIPTAGNMARLMNHIYSEAAVRETLPTTAVLKGIVTVVLQMHWDGDAQHRAAGLESLRSFPLDTVSDVYKELYVNRLLRKVMPPKDAEPTRKELSEFELTHHFENSFKLWTAPFHSSLQSHPAEANGAIAWELVNTSRSNVSQYESLLLTRWMSVARGALHAAISVSITADVDYNRPYGSCVHQEDVGTSQLRSAKLVDLVTVGHCHKALNRVSLGLAADNTHTITLPVSSAASLSTSGPESETGEAETLCVPWRSAGGGEVNEQLLTLFVAKVQALLVELPGCNEQTIRGSFPLLSQGQTHELLRLMQQRNIVHRRTATTFGRKASPFAKQAASSSLLSPESSSFFLVVL